MEGPPSHQREEISLRGNTVLINGGSRGLKLLLAREFGAEGCRVALCARDEQELAVAREDFGRRGIEVFAARCDVADREQVDESADHGAHGEFDHHSQAHSWVLWLSQHRRAVAFAGGSRGYRRTCFSQGERDRF